jgi:hypothetical protein
MKHMPLETASMHDGERGRIEGREYAASGGVAWLRVRHPKWKSIRPIGLADSARGVKCGVGCGRRYYVSSLPACPEEFAKAVRGHRGIGEPLALCA